MIFFQGWATTTQADIDWPKPSFLSYLNLNLEEGWFQQSLGYSWFADTMKTQPKKGVISISFKKVHNDDDNKELLSLKEIAR